jgi:hypothetical protein
MAYGDPSMAELLERVEALEDARLTLKDLPLADLQRKLETSWQPNANELLQAGTATRALLDGVIHTGTVNATWPGGSVESNVIFV